MIPIFKYETQDGIADVVRSSGSLSFASAIDIVVDKEQEEKFKEWLSASAKANPEQIDLFYLESVLASVGWNRNDDVFDPQELWAARNTPVDKPFNFMHDETDIIGHLTSAKIVGPDGKIITTEESLPSQFDLVVGSVLYKAWTATELRERMQRLVAEIIAGKWSVSMECLFRQFDYAIITPDGEHKVLARNDDTSFLTKHLKFYGGSGTYQDHKIGRLLRSYTFSGKGLVDNPANPRSKITNFDNKSEISSFAGHMTTASELNITNEQEISMSGITQEAYDALRAELEALKASKVSEAQEKLDSANKEIAELKDQVTKLNNDLEVSKEVANAKDENITALKAELDGVKTELSEAKASIEAQKLEATKAARKAKLLEKVDEAKAATLVEKFTSASDEMFDALVESLPAKYMEDEEDEDKKKKDKKKADASADEDVDTDIDEANASDDADINVGGDDVPVDKVAKASSWFSDYVIRTTAKTREGE